MEKWLDREKIKSKISGWLVSDIPHYLLTIEDSQEFEDVTIWLESLKEFNTSIAYLNTDSEITQFGLLEEIVDGFGRENFPTFNVLNSSFSAMDPKIIIEQRIGTDITAIKTDVSTNTQTVNINNFDLESVRVFYIESKINEFLDSFLVDLSNIDFGNTNFIICRFRGSGFSQLDEKFKGWFQDQFVRRIKKLKIKIIVLCELNAGELNYSFDYQYQFNLKNLHLDDILPVALKYLNDESGYFCSGAVGRDNTISYKDFSFKLQRKLTS